MALAVLHSRALTGMHAPPVAVEVYLANGLPSFTIVGLPEAEVREARDRVRAALQNARFEFPARDGMPPLKFWWYDGNPNDEQIKPLRPSPEITREIVELRRCDHRVQIQRSTVRDGQDRRRECGSARRPDTAQNRHPEHR